MLKDNELKILVVGCGAISRHWFEYTLGRTDSRIVGIVDLNRASAEEKAARYGLDCGIYGSVDEALSKCRPDITYDLTYVTTHIDVVVKALRAGSHVFGEKPMAITREEAERMVKTADETGKTYSVMQNRRYQKPVRAVREIVESGQLGRIWTINAEIFVGEDLASIRNLLEKPMLQDNAIHSFDQARFIIGADPVSVYCHSYNPVESKYKGDAAGVCIFEMSDGSVFVYNCVMGVQGCRTSWESSWRIIGSRGSVIWDGSGAPYAEVVVEENGNKTLQKLMPQSVWEGREQHFGCLDEMFGALLAGERSRTDCHDNYKSISMTFSSIESARLERRIKVF